MRSSPSPAIRRSPRRLSPAASSAASPLSININVDAAGHGNGASGEEYEEHRSSWGTEPVSELTGTNLEWSTIQEVDGKKKLRKKKACWLCGKVYAGGPDVIRIHLDRTLKPRDVGACIPKPENKARFNVVLAELRRRRLHAEKEEKAQAEKVQLQLEGRVAARGMTVSEARAKDFFKFTTAEDVTQAWLKVCVKKALPLDLFDEPLFREAVVLTAKCAGKILGAHQQLELPKRKKITEKVLPAFDKELDARIKTRMHAIMHMTGVTVLSDGWTSCANRPILNALLASPLGCYFVKADDTSGDTKDAQYVADYIIDVINDTGPELVTAVCMDGACKSSFSLIEHEHPHVFCYICPTHSLDNFMKNVCSGEKETINVRGYDGPALQWGEKLFSETFDKVTQDRPALSRLLLRCSPCPAGKPPQLLCTGVGSRQVRDQPP